MSIDILGDRFIGMFKEQCENGFVLRLEVDFTPMVRDLRWTVFNKKDNKEVDFIFVTPKSGHSNNIYHILGMEGRVTFDDLINHSKHIINFNTDIEEKKLLLKQKFEELGELFAKHDIEDLRCLDFVIRPQKKDKLPAPTLTPQPKTRKPRKKREKEIVENFVQEENKTFIEHAIDNPPTAFMEMVEVEPLHKQRFGTFDLTKVNLEVEPPENKIFRSKLRGAEEYVSHLATNEALEQSEENLFNMVDLGVVDEDEAFADDQYTPNTEVDETFVDRLKETKKRKK